MVSHECYMAAVFLKISTKINLFALRLILLTFLVLILRKGEFHENFLRMYNVLYSTER
jgi:hypothetical protein